MSWLDGITDNGHEFELTPGDSEGQVSLMCCSSWSLKESDKLSDLTTKILEIESESCSVVSDFLWPHGLYSPWNSPGQNTGVGSLSLLQRIFPTRRLNPGLPHCRRILYQLSYQGRRVLYIQNREYKAFGQICPGWKIL